MRAAATIILGLATACSEPIDEASSKPDALATLREELTLFFPLDESRGVERIDRVSDAMLLSWQRQGFGAYAVDARGTTAVPGAVGQGQHIAGSEGFHFAMYHHPALGHEAGSFTWAGWVSVDAADGDKAHERDQTWVAKWNGIPDTSAPENHREYRIWHDQARGQLRFEVSADGHEGDEHSKIVTHDAPIERDRLYFVEAWHDADAARVGLRVSTQQERGQAVTEPWQNGVFAGDAELNVGAQNTCTDAHLQGTVDALGYWQRVLQDGESRALWNGGAGRELTSDAID
jgi:hypothetical protein